MFHIVINQFLGNASDREADLIAHQNFLELNHRAAIFLVSGSMSNQDGSVIIAFTQTREELIDILEQDPLRKRELIDFKIIDFDLNRRALSFTEELFLGHRLNSDSLLFAR